MCHTIFLVARDTQSDTYPRKMEAAWSEEKVCWLIELYRSSPVLWDPTNVNYRNKMKRQDAYKDISDIINMEREEVERKIKNIVGQFSRELKRLREKNSGGGAENEKQSKWFAFKLLSFLKDRNKSRERLDTEKVINEIVC